MGIFRAYDIRGVYNKDLDETKMLRLGKALGTLLGGNKNVAVGYDTRISSKRLFDHFSKGLTSTGCNVINLGMVTTPMLNFYAWKNKTFGAMITASHNSKNWNGLKLIRPSGISFINELEDLEKTFKFGKFVKGNGKLRKDSVMEKYGVFIKRKIGNLSKKVVVECFGGSGVVLIPLMKRTGLDVTSLHDVPDGNFYGFKPDPEKPGNLKTLKKTVKEKKADFGIAFDGDGDRALFVDERGNEIDASMAMAIFIDYVLSSRKRGKVIVTQDSSRGLEKIAENGGGKVIWNRIGHGFIERRITFEKALFGGEQSGHMSFNDFYPFSDGLVAALYMAKILEKEGNRLSVLVKDKKFSAINPVGKFYMDLKMDDKVKDVIKKLRKKYHNEKKVQDGFMLKLNKAEWVMIRASDNAPEINLCIEAKSKKRLKELKEKYAEAIRKAA